ncbi:PPE family domain protein [Mycobacterium kansasii 662]|uniref:PPE family domain protein n=1 Tax=Mycobacterium kansasii 662 TaxID=1299326 RepID=X7ZR79_MYCKA|nr:hypothetical protein [Mycobacterium kansasii]EUA21561.1 PPE family domain protein [Mycobacterium kansasii 662]
MHQFLQTLPSLGVGHKGNANIDGHGISGFFNSASGGPLVTGVTSGFFNTGVTDVMGPFPSGMLSGFNSGFFNTGIANSGLLSLGRLIMLAT